MQRVKDVDSLYNFIGYVVLTAPDKFPRRDYLTEDEQMTLDKAFGELRHGLALVQQQAPDLPGIDRLASILDESLAFYRQGDNVRAAHLLQDFEAAIYKN